MNQCNGETGWSYLSSTIEIISILTILGLFSKSIWETYRMRETEEYENLDILLVILSVTQIFTMILVFVFGQYFGLFVFYEIFKLSQNTAIAGCLLFQLLLALNYSITFKLVKAYFIVILSFDIFIVFVSFSYEYEFFSKDFGIPFVLWLLPIIGIIVDLSVISYTIYLDCNESNNEQGTSLNKDNYNLNNIIRKYTSSIKKMQKYYFIIVIAFAISYFIDLCFKLLINNNNCEFGGIYQANNTSNNSSNFNSTYNYTTQNQTNSAICPVNYFQTNFGFKEFIICLISFYLRDLGPHIYLYFALFYFKTKNTSRSSSFIELA